MKITINEGCGEIEVMINCPEVTEQIRKIAAALNSLDERISGVTNGHTHMVERRDVFYFESVDKRCFFYTAGDCYETPLKLYEIEEHMAGRSFFRSSKSQIVNLTRIKSLCPDFNGRIEVVMENGEKLIVSRQYARLLKERLGIR